MQRFELTINKTSRLFMGIIIIGISCPGLVILSSKLDNTFQKIIIPISILILLLGFVHQLAFAKLILTVSNDTLSFQWKKRFLFNSKEISPVKILDIKKLVFGKGSTLNKIITRDRVIEINTIKPIKKDFQNFIDYLIKTVINNKGQIMNIDEYATEQGYNDLSFKIFVMLFAFSIFLISRLWGLIEFYSLLLLLIPFFAYVIHVKQRIRKKTGGNIL
ncbi:hypothetical protein ACE01N_20145 [Saccharicrinis sp. FJH2]|uniref:hypothetical protein n=1 Tax=Saccharicrinis sp. FJH65 TaxID=3344659 RepID=UPI0035F2D71A